MKTAALSTTLLFSLSLLTPTPTQAYVYGNYPVNNNNNNTDDDQQQQQQQQGWIIPTTTTIQTPQNSTTEENVKPLFQESRDSYLNSLLQYVGMAGNSGNTETSSVAPPQQTSTLSYQSPQEPDQQVQETLEEQMEQIQEAAEEQMEQVQENLEEQMEQVAEALEEQMEQIQEHLEEQMEQAEEQNQNKTGGYYGPGLQEVLEELQEQAQETAEEIQEQAQETEEEIQEQAQEMEEEIQEQAQETAEEQLEQVQEIYNDSEEDLTTTPTYAPSNNDESDEDSEEAQSTTTVQVPIYGQSTEDVSDDMDDDQDHITYRPVDDSEEDDASTAMPVASTTEIQHPSTTTTTTTTTPSTTTTEIHDDISDDVDDDDDVTTTTQAPVSSPATISNLCEGCEMKHGVGYNRHPTDCTLFVQCRYGAPLVPGGSPVPVPDKVRSCPHGLYWNQHKLTCDHQKNVRCVDDICRSKSPKKTKMAASSCRGFWDCSSGQAVAKCCAEGFAYNPITNRCNYHPSCKDECLSTPTPPFEGECNGMRGVAGQPAMYEVKTGPNTWTPMPCPPTLAFSTFPCGCTKPLKDAQPPQQVCKPQLYLPFDKDVKDASGKNVYVENKGVLVQRGKAYFDGRSSLLIPRFSYAWWGATVYVHLKYKTFPDMSGVRQSLVANGDCDSAPSMSVCAASDGVNFFAATSRSYQPANLTVPFDAMKGQGWQDVLFRLEGGSLRGFVNNNQDQMAAKGNLQTTKRGLVIGKGKDCSNFVGFMDEITVYLCSPYFK